MKLRIRNSNLKRARMTGFLKRRRTKGGQAILANQRRKKKLKTGAKRRRIKAGQAHKLGKKR